MKKALITGITGQDGSYLAELLLNKGYAVHGLVRRASAYNRTRIDHLRTDENLANGRLVLHYGELNDLTSFHRLLHKIEPNEIYHLAGQSHVGLSFEIPEVTCLENGMATLHLLEAMREMKTDVRLYLAGSSEIFGAPQAGPQTELTPLDPRNPYGAAKAFAFNLGKIYRESHGLYVANGILYNHESPHRGENFVTRKISMAAARWAGGQKAPLELGNLDGCRDWGYAAEYVEGMWRMLQAENGADFVLATGVLTTVREFARAAYAAIGVELEFAGAGPTEVGRCARTREIVVTVSPRFYRPVDATHLLGDATKAREVLGWSPQTAATDLAKLMVETDVARVGAH
ncbi:GDP-mannose 4,6-dehydratase [Synoicihabitans lomoniglobus]|uniref:GDP-mannose 4,6-dehydratase n=1 Tax=Synoicihabitans lomoniglobus TaxID=2909285 RepID=A0AAF0CQS3_9BACT|nr:GDP-mannose 4,6-dehydratase [Opitutaceae bacterium LMO-M01]WED66332.1 GDP-mannose 4,6-dehydratase [Opitutaceae bacterium LMO-M01]